MVQQAINSHVSVDFDDDGFLTEPTRWSRSLALTIARRDGVEPLTEAHWSVIRSLRAHFNKYGTPPMFRHVCFVHQLDKHCVDTLFHTGREAWRIAGLPNPGEEAKTYM